MSCRRLASARSSVSISNSMINFPILRLKRTTRQDWLRPPSRRCATQATRSSKSSMWFPESTAPITLLSLVRKAPLIYLLLPLQLVFPRPFLSCKTCEMVFPHRVQGGNLWRMMLLADLVRARTRSDRVCPRRSIVAGLFAPRHAQSRYSIPSNHVRRRWRSRHGRAAAICSSPANGGSRRLIATTHAAKGAISFLRARAFLALTVATYNMTYRAQERVLTLYCLQRWSRSGQREKGGAPPQPGARPNKSPQRGNSPIGLH